MAEEDCCEKCRFYEVTDSSTKLGAPMYGQCRRRTPRPGHLDVRWPEVFTDEWCGEFEAEAD